MESFVLKMFLNGTCRFLERSVEENMHTWGMMGRISEGESGSEKLASHGFQERDAPWPGQGGSSLLTAHCGIYGIYIAVKGRVECGRAPYNPLRKPDYDQRLKSSAHCPF